MAYETLDLGITLTLPTNSTTNWGTTLKNTTWTKISGHNHTGGGNGLQLGTQAIQANAITSSRLAKNLVLAVASTLTPAGTTQNVDFNNGNTQNLNLGLATGTVTLTFLNGTFGGFYTIWITQGATPRAVSWPVGTKWAGGSAPTLTASAFAIDKITLYYNGSVYLAEAKLDWR